MLYFLDFARKNGESNLIGIIVAETVVAKLIICLVKIVPENLRFHEIYFVIKMGGSKSADMGNIVRMIYLSSV